MQDRDFIHTLKLLKKDPILIKDLFHISILTVLNWELEHKRNFQWKNSSKTARFLNYGFSHTNTEVLSKVQTVLSMLEKYRKLMDFREKESGLDI